MSAKKQRLKRCNSTPVALSERCTMKARSSAPIWVQNLRGTLRESVGKSYTVTQQGNNCKVIVRFQNKITKYLTLPYEWNKANSRP